MKNNRTTIFWYIIMIPFGVILTVAVAVGDFIQLLSSLSFKKYLGHNLKYHFFGGKYDGVTQCYKCQQNAIDEDYSHINNGKFIII